MPRGNQMPIEDQLVKLLLVAPSKMGKTHFCMEAAKSGFNVLYLDGDVSRPTIQQFDSGTLNRLWYMNLVDTQKMARMWQLVERMFSTPNYLWDDTNQQSLLAADVANVAVWKINLVDMSNRDVLVIDSWSSLVNSVKQAVAKQIGVPLQSLGEGNSREFYGKGNLMVDFILKCILGIKCHVIVTAHPGEYEHKIKPTGLVSNQKERDMKIAYVRAIPASISNPHGSKMGKDFTDVCWLTMDAMGNRQIDGRPNPDRAGGGRFNKLKATSEYSFKQLVKEAGGLVPDSQDSFPTISGITEYGVGEYEAAESPATKQGILQSKGGTIKL